MKRLVTDAIRKALNLHDRGCTEIGCTTPAEFCEAHHIVPWSQGGKTSLTDCKLGEPHSHIDALIVGLATAHERCDIIRYRRRWSGWLMC